MSEATYKPSPPSTADSPFLPHTSHWGVFSARWHDGKLEVRPHSEDPDPNDLIENFPDALHHRARIARPMVRRGWLERGPGPDDRRGRDEYLPLFWDTALDLLGAELARVRDTHGPGAVFGGLMAGRAQAASIMRRVKSIAFLTRHWAAMSAPLTATVPVHPQCFYRMSLEIMRS